MQVPSLSLTPVSTGRAAPSSAVARVGAPPATSVAPSSRAAHLPRSGLRTWQPELNREVARAQQSGAFLDGVAARLQALKSGLSAQLAGRADGGRVASELAALDKAWRTRSSATGGALDAQLRYSADGNAQQRFTVRGLDFATLQTGEPETLALTVGPLGQRPLPVVVEPGLSERAIVLRLSQALAPAGVQALHDEQGQLTLATPQSQWATVRDTLAVRGGGQRFPTGQFHRVRAEPEAEAVPVATWKTDSVPDRQRTLQGVLQALDRVRQARGQVDTALASAQVALASSAPSEGADWAVAAAARFQETAADVRFSSRAALASAVDGMNRDRVRSLLTER